MLSWYYCIITETSVCRQHITAGHGNSLKQYYIRFELKASVLLTCFDSILTFIMHIYWVVVSVQHPGAETAHFTVLGTSPECHVTATVHFIAPHSARNHTATKSDWLLFTIHWRDVGGGRMPDGCLISFC